MAVIGELVAEQVVGEGGQKSFGIVILHGTFRDARNTQKRLTDGVFGA
jgi:hypothetical protein